MKRWHMFSAVVVVLAFAAPTLAGEKCTCKAIYKDGSGWCSPCKEGAVHSVAIKSGKLYKALRGVEVKDKGKMKCGGCTIALKKNGKCDHCKVAFHDGKYYRSPVAVVLASGKSIDAKAVKCGGCKKAAYSKKGSFCSPCSTGFVGGMAFAGAKLFQEALMAMNTLVDAAGVSGKCESCAVAMVTNGKCDQCKVEFKDGKKAKKVKSKA